jgi:hypothetical protein
MVILGRLAYIREIAPCPETVMRPLSALVLVTVLVASPAWADPPWERDGGRRGHEQQGGRQERDIGNILITAAEKALIGDYYRGQASQSLPPGIRKKVARGKPLPPGIAKNFPDDLRGRLPPRPGYDWRSVGPDVVLVEAATGVVVDVLKDILR